MEKISVCSQCKQEAPMTKAGKSGHRPYCKPCWNEKRKAWALLRPAKERGPPPVKACSTCGEVREMTKSGKDGYRSICKPCWNAEQKQWRERNPDKWKALTKRYVQKNRLRPEWIHRNRARGREYFKGLRNQALQRYGTKCACCGEAQDEFLTIDHIDNDGAEHRRRLKSEGSFIFKWLRDNDYPDGFQTLCMNCNFGKFKNRGVCPHLTIANSKVA